MITASDRPTSRLLNICVMREYSPLSSIVVPSTVWRLSESGSKASHRVAPVLLARRFLSFEPSEMPVDHAIDVAADMAEVAAGDADVEVDGGEDVLVGDLGWDGAASELDEGAEQHRRRIAVVGRPLHAT